MIGKHFEHIFILNKQNMPPIIFTPVARGGSWGSDEPPPPWKQISTIKVNILFKNCDYQSPNWCKIWWKSLKKTGLSESMNEMPENC